jgi:hypothetical protein
MGFREMRFVEQLVMSKLCSGKMEKLTAAWREL